jgi:hypothetical protein
LLVANLQLSYVDSVQLLSHPSIHVRKGLLRDAEREHFFQFYPFWQWRCTGKVDR